MKNKKLILARKEKGLTQSQVADYLELSNKSVVSNWENGHSNPRMDLAINLCKLYKKNLDELFGGNEDE